MTKVPPRAAPHELLDCRQLRVGLGRLAGLDAGQLFFWWQDPFSHFSIAAFRQPDSACRWLFADDFGGECHPDPVGVGFEQREEPFKPTLLKAGAMGVGPDTELLTVVSKDGKGSVPPGSEKPEVLKCRLGSGKGDDVPQVLTDRKDRQRLAVTLSQPVPIELVICQAGCLEMKIVEDGPFDTGRGEVGGHPGVPDPLGHPHAGDLCSQAVFQPVGVAADLANSVAGRQHGQHRLVKGTTDNFDLLRCRQFRQSVEILRMVRLQPLCQRAAGMHGQPDAGVPTEEIEHRPVAVLIGLLKDTVEVSDRLVVVEDKAEADSIAHWRDVSNEGAASC